MLPCGGAHLVGVEDVVISDVPKVARAGGNDILEHASLVCGLLHPYIEGKGALGAPLHALNRHARPCIHVILAAEQVYIGHLTLDFATMLGRCST